MTELSLLEIHAAHACDLTCESCAHFSGDGHRGYVSVEQAIEWCRPWAKRLRPDEFGILGGEPTLNPDLPEFIEAMARLWPQSKLKLTTNGLALHRHRTLPDVLARCSVKVCLSIHYNSDDYVRRIRDAAKWLRSAGAGSRFRMVVRESFTNWTRRYLGRGADVLPYDDKNPRKSWEHCVCKWCRQIYEGRLWKCSTMAYLHLHERRYGSLDPAWKPYLAYDGISPDVTDVELQAALAREDEPICGACPSQPHRFRKPDPTIRLGMHRSRPPEPVQAPDPPAHTSWDRIEITGLSTEDSFNGSAVKIAGNYVMAYRPRNGSGSIGTAWLDETLKTIPGSTCDFPLYRTEDPRLFLRENGDLLMSTNCWDDNLPSEMELRRLGYDLTTRRIWEHEVLGTFRTIDNWPGYQKRQEKNWVPFERHNELFYVYSVRPHRILRFCRPTGRVSLFAESDWQVPPWWRTHWGSELRLSSCPSLLSDGTFLSTWHTNTRLGYWTGFYEFEAEPRFE